MRAKPPVVHLYFSNMAHESRLLREAKAAVEEGLADEAIGIGYRDGQLSPSQTMADRVRFLRLDPPAWMAGGGKIARLLRWPMWTWSAAHAAARERPSIVQAHSLAALPASILAARLFGKSRLVYDAHELESERAGWSRGLRKAARLVERALIGFADETIVVSGAIADWYADAYGIEKPHLVRNMPEATEPAPARDSRAGMRAVLGLGPEAIILVYLGRLGKGRGIELLVDAFQLTESSKHLVFMGDGPMGDWLRRKSSENANIHLLDPVPSEQVIEFVSSADVGFSMIEDVSLSYRYCLPNKLFESRSAGLAVIVSDLVEMANFVRTYGGGWIVENKASSLADLINGLSKDAIMAARRDARPVPTWTEERRRYLDIVRPLVGESLSSPSPAAAP